MQLRKKNHEKIDILSRTISSANLGIWSLDIRTGCISASDRCREMFDLPPELSPSIDDIKKLIKQEYVLKALEAFTLEKANADTLTLEMPVSTFTNLSIKWLRVTAFILFDQQHSPTEIHGSLLDITEWKIAEKLNQDSLAMVCHDLRSPVAVVKLCVQMGMRAADQVNDDLMFSMMQRADRQLNHMHKMIQSFLDVPILQSGQMKIDLALFQINELVEEVVADMRLLNRQCQLVLKSGANAQVYADRDKIGQVLFNLLANAIKYAPGKNILWVTSTAMDDRIQIAVKDFGVGIKKTDQDKIFNQYYRVENKMTGEICGHGLGLFIAKQIILEHGGLIWLESEENKGSTFYFTLPLVNKLPLKN
jgi:two-component system sensor histidine kinase VicK